MKLDKKKKMIVTFETLNKYVLDDGKTH